MCLIKAWPVTSPLSRGLLQHSCTAKTAPSSADCWLPIKQWKGLGIHTHLSWQRPNLQPACHRVSVSGLIYTCHGWSLQSAETVDGQVVPTPPQPAPLLPSLSRSLPLLIKDTPISMSAERGHPSGQMGNRNTVWQWSSASKTTAYKHPVTHAPE